ncbi:hypothetical protein KCU73_g13562, partial [Aureobasidium melanogenum]
EETMGQDVVQDHPEVVAPSEDIVQVTGNTRTEQSWPFNEPPNLVRHVPNANQTEQIGAPIKDEPKPEIEPPVDNEERSFRPPSPAVPPIMDEVASDGYASSCDEHGIHRAIIHSTKRMKPAKVKKGYLIQAKVVLREANGATVNAINGKPGVTRTLRAPANTTFRQLTDVLNTAFG